MANLLKMCSTESPAASAHEQSTFKSRSKPAPAPQCHFAIIKNKSLLPEERFAQLVRQLIDCPKIINTAVKDGMTALHHAVLEGDEMCTKALIVFGADINALNHFDQTPLDIAMENQRLYAVLAPLLLSVGCECGNVIKRRQLQLAASLYPSPQWQVMKALADESPSACQGQHPSPPTTGLTAVQPGEEYQHTDMRDLMQSSLEFSEKEGNRILCLDGGGVRGLIQIEVLGEIERITGNKITEIFDWIIGTSTGGIIALLLVYKNKKLRKLRKSLFRITKASNSEELERVLKEEFGTEIKMSDIKHPKVLITAVHKASTQPKLHFFNNCFGDEFSTQPVWKVARYTSAATEFENYVDGGVLANNPCDEGLIKIQSHYRHLGVRILIPCVVSIGCGVYPASDTVCCSTCGVAGNTIVYSTSGRSDHFILHESEAVAEKCREQCRRHSIHFYRVSPTLRGDIPTEGTELNKLVDVLIENKMWLCAQGEELCRLKYALGQHPTEAA